MSLEYTYDKSYVYILKSPIIDGIPLSEDAVRPSQGKTRAVMQVCGGSYESGKTISYIRSRYGKAFSRDAIGRKPLSKAKYRLYTSFTLQVRPKATSEIAAITQYTLWCPRLCETAP